MERPYLDKKPVAKAEVRYEEPPVVEVAEITESVLPISMHTTEQTFSKEGTMTQSVQQLLAQVHALSQDLMPDQAELTEFIRGGVTAVDNRFAERNSPSPPPREHKKGPSTIRTLLRAANSRV